MPKVAVIDPKRHVSLVYLRIENTFNYPTLAEAYKIAALDAWNRFPKA